MKNILFYAFVIFNAIIFLSNNAGRGRVAGPATASPVENGTFCGTIGCHFGSNFQPNLDIQMINAEGESVTEYLPGESYTISLKINHVGFPAGYGFQIVSLKDDDNAGINNWIDIPGPMHDVFLSGRQYVEQDSRLPTDSIPLTWQAPEEGSGSVTFYAAANAVNGNGNSGGDGADTSFLKITEAEISSLSELTGFDVSVYPNPAVDIIYVDADNMDVIKLYNAQGQLILSTTEQSASLNGISPGIIILEVVSGQKRTFKKILKI